MAEPKYETKTVEYVNQADGTPARPRDVDKQNQPAFSRNCGTTAFNSLLAIRADRRPVSYVKEWKRPESRVFASTFGT